MPTADANTTTSTTRSEGDNVPEVSAALSKVASLEPGAIWWSNAVLLMTGLTALAALLYFAAELISNSKSKALDAAKSELIAAQNRQRDREQSEADARIAEAHAEGSKANERSARLALELEQQRELTAKAQQGVLDLAAAMGPRRIAMGARGDGRTSDRDVRQARFAMVAKYAGTLAIIQSVVEPEAQTLASDIATALVNSGWKVALTTEEESGIPQGLIREGVTVITREQSPFVYGPPPEVTLRPFVFSPASEAARALVELLTLDLGNFPFGIQWSPEYVSPPQRPPLKTGDRFNFPDGAVVILVGLRPTEFLESHMKLQTK